jgi:hypothetical protein
MKKHRVQHSDEYSAGELTAKERRSEDLLIRKAGSSKKSGPTFLMLGEAAIFGVGVAAIVAWSGRRILSAFESVDIVEREPEPKHERGQYGRRK